MRIEKYKFYVNELKKDFTQNYNTTQILLNESENKKADKRILQAFFNGIILDIVEDYELYEKYNEMLEDNEAIMPMPESVSKQLATLLFDIKHLNPLFDMPIEEGFY